MRCPDCYDVTAPDEEIVRHLVITHHWTLPGAIEAVRYPDCLQQGRREYIGEKGLPMTRSALERQRYRKGALAS